VSFKAELMSMYITGPLDKKQRMKSGSDFAGDVLVVVPGAPRAPVSGPTYRMALQWGYSTVPYMRPGGTATNPLVNQRSATKLRRPFLPAAGIKFP
jgi:hypothetical protein